MFQSSLTAKCGIEYFPFRHASLPPQSCRKFCCACDILRELVRCYFGVNLQAFLRLLGGCLYGRRTFRTSAASQKSPVFWSTEQPYRYFAASKCCNIIPFACRRWKPFHKVTPAPPGLYAPHGVPAGAFHSPSSEFSIPTFRYAALLSSFRKCTAKNAVMKCRLIALILSCRQIGSSNQSMSQTVPRISRGAGLSAIECPACL